MASNTLPKFLHLIRKSYESINEHSNKFEVHLDHINNQNIHSTNNNVYYWHEKPKGHDYGLHILFLGSLLNSIEETSLKNYTNPSGVKATWDKFFSSDYHFEEILKSKSAVDLNGNPYKYEVARLGVSTTGYDGKDVFYDLVGSIKYEDYIILRFEILLNEEKDNFYAKAVPFQNINANSYFGSKYKYYIPFTEKGSNKYPKTLHYLSKWSLDQIKDVYKDNKLSKNFEKFDSTLHICQDVSQLPRLEFPWNIKFTQDKNGRVYAIRTNQSIYLDIDPLLGHVRLVTLPIKNTYKCNTKSGVYTEYMHLPPTLAFSHDFKNIQRTKQ